MTEENEKKKEYLQQTWWIPKRIREMQDSAIQKQIKWRGVWKTLKNITRK